MEGTIQSWRPFLLAFLLGSQTVRASIDLDLSSTDSIKSAAKEAAKGMLSYYTGYRPGDVPGNIPDPYYWWEAGAMFGAMVEYWYYTGDSQWNDWTTQALLHQTGEDNDYMPYNQTRSMGNDDQIFWAFTVMSAAETKYPNPPQGQPQWLELAENVFNSQAARWDTSTCGGGLHWQAYESLGGWHLKNSISNGGLFNVASRLALYTGNQTYADWANKIWDWCEGIGLITDKYDIYDNTDSKNNCTTFDRTQHAYLPAVFMHGAANMYSLSSNANDTTNTTKWKKRVNGITNALSAFFYPQNKNIMSQPCEVAKCNVNEQSFKAYLARFMGATVPLAPFTQDRIMTKINASAQAAAKQCNGPDNKCGLRWTDGDKYDDTTGIGEQMSALEVIQATLVHVDSKPVSHNTGGTSTGNKPGIGDSDERNTDVRTRDVTKGDKAGAGILVVLFVLAPVGALVFLSEMV
ncbi:Six-hairpin glycosidase [Penicillium argentinense]|uniref:Mannan endo-1,6-alpha-mannosidase n=1 Tax=Penicillium argentinense TaxID=1131581 RepID=A0A9W9G0U1_9EURO|nr:Six-hairpin glycosidase [Penicillium argentinense]KAJ5110051.1 Six-hairpin glycosidase [Penicillium argentinense]